MGVAPHARATGSMTLQFDTAVFISNSARDLVLDFRSRSDSPAKDDLAMWIEVTGISGANFSYDMYLKDWHDAGPDDAVVEVAPGLNVVVPDGSVDQLDGATIDYRPSPNGGGLFVDNPNSPSPVAGPAAQHTPTPQLSGELAEQIAKILEQQINPAIAAHGGHAELVSVEDGAAYLRLSGGCQGCGMAAVTLTQGIEVAIREAVPEISRVIDVTDHASGENPYFEASKK